MTAHSYATSRVALPVASWHMISRMYVIEHYLFAYIELSTLIQHTFHTMLVASINDEALPSSASDAASTLLSPLNPLRPASLKAVAMPWYYLPTNLTPCFPNAVVKCADEFNITAVLYRHSQQPGSS